MRNYSNAELCLETGARLDAELVANGDGCLLGELGERVEIAEQAVACSGDVEELALASSAHSHRVHLSPRLLVFEYCRKTETLNSNSKTHLFGNLTLTSSLPKLKFQTILTFNLY